MIEIIGYLGSGLVALSMIFSNIVWLRIFNTTGAIAFIIYGAITPAIPVLLTNVFILVVNFIHLIRDIQKKKREKTEEE